MSEPPKKKQRKIPQPGTTTSNSNQALPIQNPGTFPMSSVSFPSAQISTQYPSAQLAFSPQSVSLPISVPNTNMRPQVLSPIQTQNGSNPGSSQSMTPFPGGNLLQGANLLQNMSNSKAITSQQMTQSQQNTPANTQPNQGILPSTQAVLQSKNQGATATQGLQKPQDPLVKALESLVPLQTFTQLQAMAQFQVQSLVQNPARPGNIFGQISANNMPRPSPQGITLPQRPPNVNVPAAFSPNNTSSEQAIKSLSSFEENKAGPFSRRERYYEEMEKNGSYKFHYIQNDGKRQSLIWLVALKNIFSRQLPNMPKEYITRLVFDRRHRSVAVTKQDGSVAGGITYRPFSSQAFGEIAFCAVTSSDQVKGFGSRLMSHTKEFAKKKDKLTFFLTYADNNAVTFFAKQGFTTEVTSQRDQWQGYIKDYDGGTLMECLLEEELCYTSLAGMIQAQTEALKQRMSGLCTAFVSHQGLDYFKTPNIEPLRFDQIPGLIEAGWASEKDPKPHYKLIVDGDPLEPTKESIHHLGKIMVADLQGHDDAIAFLQPVKAEEVPDYAEIIKNPIDLSKIQQQLEAGTFYITLELLEADIRRIFKNAKVYNASDTYWYKAANRLEQYFDRYLALHMSPA